jgi:hypothetical protein
MPYWTRVARLDRRHSLQGVLNTGVTYWTLPENDNTVDVAVLAATAFGDDEGTVLQVANAGGSVVYVNGDYTAGCCVVGRSFNALIELSESNVRNQQGLAINTGEQFLQDATVRHHNSGYYQLKVVPASSNVRVRTETFEASDNDIERRGRQRAFVGQNVEDVVIKIESTSPKPMTIVAVEHQADYTGHSQES